MRRNLAEDLARTFRAAALAAPDAEPSFPAALAARRRRRARARTASAAAAFAAVAAVLAGAVAYGLPAVQQRELARPIDAPPPGSAVVDASTARPYREVWPEALVELPLRLPDGRRYSVKAALDGDTYLVVPLDDRGPYLPLLLDGRTGAATELAMPTSGFVEYRQTGLYLTERHIALVLAGREADGATYHEVWSVPRDGGAAVRRARFGPEEKLLVAVAEVGGVLYASTEPPSGVGAVYRLADGGAPRKVAGSDGYTLRYGPWAARRSGLERTVQPLSRAPVPSDPPQFWNVATGERLTPRTPDGVAVMRCNPRVCVGVAGGSLVSYGVDGGDPLWLTGVEPRPAFDGVFFDGPGRFIQVRTASGWYLWDRKTNTLGLQDDGSSGDGDVIDVGQRGGRRHLLVLARIS